MVADAGAAVSCTAGTALAATYVHGVTAAPALVLVGSGALVLSAFGYTAGDVVMRLIGSPGISDMLLATSALAVGLVLDVDGAGVKSGLAHPGRIRQVGHFGD